MKSPVLYWHWVGLRFLSCQDTLINATFEVLHPYYKLAYIGISWGGPNEQAAEIEAGNPHAKDWQDEARKIVEKTVSSFVLSIKNYYADDI